MKKIVHAFTALLALIIVNAIIFDCTPLRRNAYIKVVKFEQDINTYEAFSLYTIYCANTLTTLFVNKERAIQQFYAILPYSQRTEYIRRTSNPALLIEGCKVIVDGSSVSLLYDSNSKYKIKDAATYAGIGRVQVYQLKKKGWLHHVTIRYIVQ